MPWNPASRNACSEAWLNHTRRGKRDEPANVVTPTLSPPEGHSGCVDGVLRPTHREENPNVTSSRPDHSSVTPAHSARAHSARARSARAHSASARSTRARSVPVRIVVAVVAVVAMVTTGLGVAPIASATPTPTSSIPARNVALWLASQVGPDGTATSPFSAGQVDVSSTLDIALSLAATGVEQAAFDRAMGWILANVDEIVAPDGGPSGPGTLGVLLMLAEATGIDPGSFGGVDLLAALTSTLGADEPGLFGELDPTYDGVFRQSLAILGLVSAGQTPPAAAVTWLVDQRCAAGPGDPLADGGWMAYRDIADPCTAPDPNNFSGADNDSTSLAVMALAALQTYPDEVAGGLDFLARWQEPSGGFAWFGGSDAVPNSTSLVVAAIVSAGEDPTTGRWVQDGVDPVTWLASQQIPCDETDAGAFTSIYSDGGPDQFATRQGVYGLALVSFPLQPVTFETDTAPCGQLPPPVVPVTPVDPAVGPGASPTPAVPVTASTATPKFTG